MARESPSPFRKTARELADDARLDRSARVLIGANVLATATALATGMGLLDLLAVYWIQSVVIGLSFFVRIAGLGQMATARFFLIHYGSFHLIYFGFLYQSRIAFGEQGADFGSVWLWLCGAIFSANHLYSLAANLRLDRRGAVSVQQLMSIPYQRILPMHFTILAGGLLSSTGNLFFAGGVALLLFTTLKTVADVTMHLAEHRQLRGGSLRDAREAASAALPPASPRSAGPWRSTARQSTSGSAGGTPGRFRNPR